MIAFLAGAVVGSFITVAVMLFWARERADQLEDADLGDRPKVPERWP